jgi:hypothetical protein
MRTALLVVKRTPVRHVEPLRGAANSHLEYRSDVPSCSQRGEMTKSERQELAMADAAREAQVRRMTIIDNGVDVLTKLKPDQKNALASERALLKRLATDGPLTKEVSSRDVDALAKAAVLWDQRMREVPAFYRVDVRRLVDLVRQMLAERPSTRTKKTTEG